MIIKASALLAVVLVEPDAEIYARAKAEGELLLFKGQDFAQTGITPALVG